MSPGRNTPTAYRSSHFKENKLEYVKVESSQIAEVGFGEGLYGPETLALRFPPNKKQKEAGELGSEYHYGNDRARYTPRETYQRLLAAPSIGAWFGQNIKPFPDQYPFTKVEAENPPQPPPSPNGGGATLLTSTVKQPTCTDVNPARNAADCSAVSSTTSRESSSVTNADTKKLPFTQEKVKTLFQSPNSTPTGTIEDAPSPGSALALMNDMADDLLFTPGKITDEQLATMRSDWLTEAKKYDISTDKARTELKRFARPLQKLRTGIEARAKELTGKMKRFVAGIDGEKRRLIMAVGRIEAEVLAGLTAWEQEEETRKTRLAHEVKRIGEMGQPYLYSGIVDLHTAIEELEGYDPSSMQEYKLSAESAIAASLKVLKPELERRKVAEAERAELDRLRAEATARAEAERVAQIASHAKAEAERRAAAEVEAANQRAALAEKMRLAEEQAAARRAEAAAAQAVRDQDQAVENERMRAAVEAKREREAAEARAANKAHRLKIDNEALGAICALDIPMDRAQDLLLAIAKGLIPHVTITY